MNRGTLVCITGLDGAGKSTLTANVVKELQMAGYNAVKAYGRYLPRLTYPMIMLGQQTVFSDSDIEENYENHQSAKEDLFDNDILASIYEGAIMIDYVPQFLYRILLNLYRHEIVVCDRYFYDTLLTDLAGDVINNPSNAINRYEFYSRFLPNPDYEFYVQIPPEVSMQRKDDVPSIEYLEDRKLFYDRFAEEHGFTILDGTMPLERLTESVVSEITTSGID